ncbi:MAG TPA: asparagine synthase (glutamine-hydrolyzing) [Thermoanaerobaculia bacterium]|nr:asparagine synthase (glutamine-hydrolyzing) [Thermoanaerobaculia bacterium]
MCGIAGFWTFAGGRPEEMHARAGRMASSLTHRGPDDAGTFADPIGAAFGFRRLSIVDLSRAGAQPMTSASGRYVIVFNGEIYNFQRLRTRLHERWRGHSDTEVLLAAIEAWGIERALGECIGMFAFALWDHREQTLSLIRDRAGVKPLYYALDAQSLQFASELKALEIDRTVDRDAAALYARYRYVPAPWSIYAGVRKLMPGSILTVSRDGTSKLTRYWNAAEVAERAAANRFHGSEEEAIDTLNELLGDSVALRMIADVPLGVFLSGGVDSSLVAALMQRNASGPIHTFTIGFEDPRFDEARYGREVAQHLGSRHHEMYVSYADALALVPHLPRIYDEPFADSSALPTYLVSKLARQSATVALSGDGGDELFAGYHHHFLGRRLQRRVRAVPQFARGTVGRVLRLVPRTRALGQGLVENDPMQTYRRGMLLDLASRPAPELQHPMPRLDDPTELVMFLDFITYLPDDILVKVDRASMAVSLEAREPFLDHRVIEFAWSLPLSMKIRDDVATGFSPSTGKWIARALLRRHLPDALVDREKQGFGVPLGPWLRGPLREWAEDLLARMDDSPFDVPRVRELWRRHVAGANHDGALWAVLMYEAWLRYGSQP